MSETVTTETKFKVIKRYKNRKLYDTEESQYVTLRDIQGFVKSGREVMVIDNNSKRDITAKTLLASIVETESDREDLSTGDVVNLIRAGFLQPKVNQTETPSGPKFDLK